MAKELADIDEIRARARLKLDESMDFLEQGNLKAFLPPGGKVWNNWRGEAWRLLIPSEPKNYHDSEPWGTHGKTVAGFTILARCWRWWLHQHDLPLEECPVEGLLDY